MNKTLFDEVVSLTEDYMGPAASRFIGRQIQFHLGYAPAELNRRDLPQLLEWIKVSLALLTDDPAMLIEFSQRASQL